jgi:hypothetical protein
MSLTIALSRGALGSLVVLASLIPMGIFLVWEALGYYASGRSKLVRMSRDYATVKSGVGSEGPLPE